MDVKHGRKERRNPAFEVFGNVDLEKNVEVKLDRDVELDTNENDCIAIG